MAPEATGAAAQTEWTRARDWIADHFDGRSHSWKQLTAEGPLGYIRETVRRGRRAMQDTILEWLPEPVAGERVLDAGCGPGSLSLKLARRGTRVVGLDISAPLVDVARERAEEAGLSALMELRVGDMLAAGDGPFTHVVAMDSLLHYAPAQLLEAMVRLADEAERTLIFTYAPRTRLLAVMHAVGTLLPARSRSPFISPLPAKRLAEGVALLEARGWRKGRTRRVKSGFYISQALEMVREGTQRDAAAQSPDTGTRSRTPGAPAP